MPVLTVPAAFTTIEVDVPGDEQSRFRTLYESEFVALLGYAARRLDHPEDAADVVAETFTVAWRRIGEVPVEGGARPWLFGVARNVLLNHRRGTARHDRLTDRLRGELRLMSLAQPPLDDDSHDIGAALGLLSPEDFELITLTVWEGMTPGQIATVLGIPAGTVRSRLHRVRQLLRHHVESAAQLSRLPIERCGAVGHVVTGEQPLAADHKDFR